MPNLSTSLISNHPSFTRAQFLRAHISIDIPAKSVIIRHRIPALPDSVCVAALCIDNDMATLIINCDGLAPTRVELKPGEYSLGADAANSIVIEHPTVSRHHCELVVEHDNKVLVRDLGSTNGTWLENGSMSDGVLDGVLLPGQSFRAGAARIIMEQPPVKPFVPRVPPAPPAIAAAKVRSEPLPASIEQPQSFLQEFPGALRYPLRGDAYLYIFIVLMLEFVQVVASMFSGILGLVLGVVVGCYLILLWQQIVHSTIDGKDQLPEMPFAGLNWSENFSLFIRYMGLSVWCFSPVIFYYIFAALNENTPGMLLYLCYGISSLYFPMAILAFLITDSLMVVCPVFIIRSIFRKLPDYLFLAGLLALGMGADALVSGLFESLIGVDPAAHSRLFHWATNIINEAVGLYCFFVWIRLVGLFYRHNKDHLAWI